MTRTSANDVLLLAMPGNEQLGQALASHLAWICRPVTVHRFPDDESLVTIPDDVQGKQVVLLSSLDQPDDKLLALLFAADAARELGAVRVGLVAPYLAYMRQDTRFHPGEAISSRSFARILSAHFDFLVTVDPHLHRYKTLDAIYTIPTAVVAAAPAVADWIAGHVSRPLLIGPDSESAQWIEATAARIGAPYTVLEKTRRGDRDVSVTLPSVAHWSDRTPVLLDDIVSSAATMIEAVGRVREAGLPAPICIAVHPVFAGHALSRLEAAVPAGIVSCNTIAHATNGIDLSRALAEQLRLLFGRAATEQDIAHG